MRATARQDTGRYGISSLWWDSCRHDGDGSTLHIPRTIEAYLAACLTLQGYKALLPATLDDKSAPAIAAGASAALSV